MDGLKAQEKATFLWDTELKGFGIKVTPAGRKAYVVDYRMPGKRKSHRYTIGQHGSPWSPDMARKEAAAKLLMASQGIDPNAEKRRRRTETVNYEFSAFADQFAEMYLKRNWSKSYDRAVSVIRCHAKPFFRNRDIREINTADCAVFIDGLVDMEATARKAAEVVGKLFEWAKGRGAIDRNPMAGVPRPKAGLGRERVHSDAELRLIWHATEKMGGHPYGPLVRFLLLSGQRKGEIGQMRWDDLDFERRVFELFPTRHKTDKGIVLPLTDPMICLLDEMPKIGPLVFTCSGDKQLGNHSQLKTKLDRYIAELNADGMDQWTLHDIRRTVATNLQRLGIGSDMIEVIQGRTKKLGAGIRYQRYDYLKEKREALSLWNHHVTGLVNVA